MEPIPHKPRFVKPCTRVWLVLMVLTFLIYGVGETGLGGTNIMLAVLGIALVKSQMIASYFMGVRKASWLWTGLFLGYFSIVGSMITLAYLMGVK